jgi:hypothetical protein
MLFPAAWILVMYLLLFGSSCTGAEKKPTRAVAEEEEEDSAIQQNRNLVLPVFDEPAKMKNLTFLLLRGVSNFADPIEQGFLDSCQEVKDQRQNQQIINCHVETFSTPSNSANCAVERLQQVKSIVQELQVTAMAFNNPTSCLNEDFISYLRNFVDSGKGLATYGKDLPAETQIGRFTFIGSDDDFMGRTVARLVRQLRPEGGTYATVGYKQGRNEAFHSELQKYNHIPGRAHWHEIIPEERKNLGDLFPQLLHNYSTMNPTAIGT